MQCTSCDVDACMVLWFFQISSNDCFSFTRENFTSHNRWEKAAAWFERQNWFLRLCPFPIYGTRWDKRSLFERGRNKSGSSWPFLKPKVSYSHYCLCPSSFPSFSLMPSSPPAHLRHQRPLIKCYWWTHITHIHAWRWSPHIPIMSPSSSKVPPERHIDIHQCDVDIVTHLRHA